MKKKILFVVSSNFQMLFTYVINALMKEHYDTYLICSSANKTVNKLVARFEDCFAKLWVIEKVQSNASLRNIKLNKKLLSDSAAIVHSINPEYLLVYKDNDALNCTLIDAASQKGAKIVLLQEGIGIYEQQRKKNLKKIIKAFIKRGLGYPETYQWVQGGNKKVNAIAVTHVERLQEEKKAGRQVVQIPKSAPPYQLIDQFRQLMDVKIDSEMSKDEKFILFLGQPLSEINLMQRDQELDFLRKLKAVIGSNGYKLIIKAHPYDELEKYREVVNDSELIVGHIPAEILPTFLKPVCILTPISSAADNIGMWYNVPVFYLLHLTLSNPEKFEQVIQGNKIKSFEQLNNELKVLSNQTDNFSNVRSEELYNAFISETLRPL